MKKQAIIFLIFSYCLVSCKKNRICDCTMPDSYHYLSAKVHNINDLSCSLPTLSFEEDSIRIKNISQVNSTVYVVKNLPAGLNIKDKKLFVKIETLKPQEEFACTTIGFSYPHLNIIEAKERE